jgi:CDP-6-deoxy-D-xylo-4-hexulose-3-dehydrase
MILTSKPEVAEQMRLLRAHGWSRNLKNPPHFPDVDSRYAFTGWGMNVRPTELQAAFGQVQLERWDLYERLRAENAVTFQKQISHLSEHVYTMQVSESAKCNWFALPLIVREGSPISRNQLAADLELSGIETRPVVAGNIARQPAAQKFPELGAENLPGADFLHDNGMYLGLHPSEDEDVIHRVVEEISRSVAQQTQRKSD